MSVQAYARAMILMTLAGCATAHGHAFTAADRTAVAAVLDDQAAAWNRGDLAGYMAGYAKTDALVFTSGAQIRTGWQAAYDHYVARYGNDRASMGTLAFEVISIDAVGADGAIVLGRWKLTDTPAAGDGVFTVVLARRAEGWRIVHDHTSSTPPPAP